MVLLELGPLARLDPDLLDLGLEAQLDEVSYRGDRLPGDSRYGAEVEDGSLQMRTISATVPQKKQVVD